MPDVSVDTAPSFLNNLAGKVVVPTDSATVTVALPERFVQRGDHLEAAPADDPIPDVFRTAKETVEILVKMLPLILLGAMGDSLPVWLLSFNNVAMARINVLLRQTVDADPEKKLTQHLLPVTAETCIAPNPPQGAEESK